MKYWRGYLVAAIVAACTWGLEQFAKGHSALVDMIYPYATRMVQTYLTQWSGGVDFLVWQVFLVAFIVLVLASIVLMVVLKWNPIQWFGWVLAAASLVTLLNTGIYGLNTYAGPISEDLRLAEADYTVSELEQTALFYGKKANELASRGTGTLTFSQMNELAADGFTYMKTQEFQSVFAGSTDPVKELGFADYFTGKGIDGVHVGITGEAALNPQLPAVSQPFVISKLMAKRMCIANEPDAAFAAFLTCRSSESPSFQYAAYLNAYYACCKLLEGVSESTGQAEGLLRVQAVAESALRTDVQALDGFYGKHTNAQQTETFCKYLVSLYIKEEILPLKQEEEVQFDPLDKTQVDLTGIANAG